LKIASFDAPRSGLGRSKPIRRSAAMAEFPLFQTGTANQPKVLCFDGSGENQGLRISGATALITKKGARLLQSRAPTPRLGSQLNRKQLPMQTQHGAVPMVSLPNGEGSNLQEQDDRRANRSPTGLADVRNTERQAAQVFTA
jgi:hypothetical protein